MSDDSYNPYDVRDPATGETETKPEPSRRKRKSHEVRTGPHSVARDQLRSLVERIEVINEQIVEIQDDRKQVFAEAKANGFDVKTLRRVIKLRQIEPAERQEQEAMLDLYMTALGMLSDTSGGAD